MAHLALLLAYSAFAYAEVFKWVDSTGTVHYSDQPAPTSILKEEKTGIRSTPPAGTNSTTVEKSLADKDMEFRKRRVEAEEAHAKQAKEDIDAKNRVKNCEQARGSLKNLQSGGRVFRHNEKGEPVSIEDSEREPMISDAKKAVDQWCK